MRIFTAASALILAWAAFAGPAGATSSTTLTFDDVVSLDAYAATGISFSANASIWTSHTSSVLTNPSGGAYSVPSALQFGNAGGVLGSIFFAGEVQDVSIWALSGPGPDLISNGSYIRAFDALGNFLGEDYADASVEFDQLRISAPGIARLDVFSPLVANDVWDNLSYSATDGTIPEPATLTLTGLALLAIRRRKAISG